MGSGTSHHTQAPGGKERGEALLYSISLLTSLFLSLHTVPPSSVLVHREKKK